MSQITDGAVVTLECQGEIQTGFKFLNGFTETGGLELSVDTNQPHTGAHWQCLENDDGTFALACAGAVQGVRYLDGRTGDGTVALVGDTLPPFSGTRWAIQEVSPDIVTIQCLGEIDGPRFLDGRTQFKTVGLADDTNPPHSGTKWKAALSASPTLNVTTHPNELGATLDLKGSGFTPGDSVEFAAEGIIGRENHVPFALGGFANSDGNGAFELDNVEIRFAEVQPNNPQVVVRGTDHNGVSAVGFTGGFNKSDRPTSGGYRKKI